MENKKPTLAIISLTCCEGCQQTILDLGEKFLTLLSKVNLVEFSWTEDDPEPDKFDLAIVEGSVVAKRDLKRLKQVRKKAGTLIALGACACLGGIPEIKNYTDKYKAVKYVYKNIRGIDNIEIKPLKEYIKIDFEIPGCPADKDEIFEILNQLLMGRIPKIPLRPVCYECILRGNDCFLLNNKMCLGPISLGGCKAVCPSNNYRCEGCRGPIDTEYDKKTGKLMLCENTLSLLKKLKKIASKKQIEMLLQKFGMKDNVL